MATSSIPAAIDYLVTTVRALPECAPSTGCTVHDGFPAGTGNPAVVIGVVPHEEGDTTDEMVYAELGAQMQVEEYSIPCVVATWVGGGEEAVKKARDAAFVIFNAIITKVRLDLTLGSALHSGFALLTRIRVDQTEAATEAGEGRACDIRFVVRCKNRL